MALDSQQEPFGRQTAGESAKPSALREDPMTGHGDRDRIAPQRPPNGPTRARRSETIGQRPVAG